MYSYQLQELIFGSDCFCQVSCLMTHWTAQASVVQRRGRAGRCKPGFCFNLFTREQFDHMGMILSLDNNYVPMQLWNKECSSIFWLTGQSHKFLIDFLHFMLLHSNLNIPSNEHDRKTKISYFNNQLTSWKDKKDSGGLRWIDNE